MSSSQPTTPRPLPGWLMALGSVLAMGHLLAIVLLPLAAQSGPWLTNLGPRRANGPMFARLLTYNVTSYYLKPLQMTHDYHFQANQSVSAATYFEVNLKDEHGVAIKTLKFPDDRANIWVRHRQEALFVGLDENQPVQAPVTLGIPGVGKSGKIYEFWEPGEGGILLLKKETEANVPKGVPLEKPSAWADLRIRAYMRYLCREYGAESAELVRHSRILNLPAYLPDVLGSNDPPAPERTMVDVKSHFGEYRAK